MSYLTQAQDPRRRAAALSGTLAIHVALGIAVVTGLTITGAVPIDDPWNPFSVTPDRDKTPPPPPQKQPENQVSSTITAPERAIDLNPVADPVETARDPVTDQVAVLPDPLPDLRPDPLPANLFAPRGARPSTSPSSWLSNADYPAGTEAEGVAGYRLVVGTNGRVSACDVTRSSGNARLDQATCRHIQRRARFEAATDQTGAKVVGTYSGTVKWEIPD